MRRSCTMIRLKELRKEKKLTQEELARDIGVSKITILRWENGERQIKPEKIQQLADYFEVSDAFLLGYSNYRTPFDQLLAAKGTDLGNGITGVSQNDIKQVSYKDSFMNFLKIHNFDLSDDDIDKVIDLVQSLSDTNKKILNNIVETGDIKKLEELKNGNFSSLFTYNSEWSDKFNNLKK